MINLMNYIMAKGPLHLISDHEDPLFSSIEALSNEESVLQYRQAFGGIFSSEEQIMNIPGMNQELIQVIQHLDNHVDHEKLRVLTPSTTSHNQVNAYVDGPDCLTLILDEIHKAHSYIHLSVMLYFNDLAGNQVTSALLQALARGVKVRVMVDYTVTQLGYGKKPDTGHFHQLANQLKAAGALVINSNYLSYDHSNWEEKRQDLKDRGVSEGILFLQDLVQGVDLIGLNIINHRKFLVIDGNTSIIGSLNIGDQYLYDTPIHPDIDQAANRDAGIPYGKDQWHDGCFRIRGTFSLPLNQLFASQWIILSGEVFNPEDDFYYPPIDRSYGAEECTLLASLPGNPVNIIRRYHLDLMKYASGAIVISNPYILDQQFWRALKDLNETQSSQITLCNSLLINDHPTNQSAIRNNMYQPFQKGVSFFDYSNTGRFSHWKIAYDTYAHCVFHGSYNLNIRSASHDFETGVIVKGQDFARKIGTLLEADLQRSEQVTDVNIFHRYPWLHPSNYFNEITRYYT
jgi:cardiolipin synthase